MSTYALLNPEAISVSFDTKYYYDARSCPFLPFDKHKLPFPDSLIAFARRCVKIPRGDPLYSVHRWV